MARVLSSGHISLLHCVGANQKPYLSNVLSLTVNSLNECSQHNHTIDAGESELISTIEKRRGLLVDLF